MYKVRIRESDQFKVVLELYDMEVQKKITMPISHSNGEEKKRSEILCSG